MDPDDEGPLDPEAFYEADAVERGRKLFAQECTFFWGAAKLGNLPPLGNPEVAFAGRSNVGKSSLLNALTGRKSLARSSQTPGRTRELNFFDLAGRLTLVDLPGYGYAKAPKHPIKAWTELLLSFLRGRSTLVRICLLIDARHGIKDVDRELMELADRSAVVFQLVLTKCDKVSKPALEETRAKVLSDCRQYTTLYPHTVDTSADTGTGIPELRSFLAGLAAPQSR